MATPKLAGRSLGKLVVWELVTLVASLGLYRFLWQVATAYMRSSILYYALVLAIATVVLAALKFVEATTVLLVFLTWLGTTILFTKLFGELAMFLPLAAGVSLAILRGGGLAKDFGLNRFLVITTLVSTLLLYAFIFSVISYIEYAKFLGP